ncbi:acyloxyacyl hydrolase [Bordetella bronchiseptica]|uniref:Lipid A 3-O-deacylase domain protein n=1 Tax=Bordetella bronchiseptica 00-P-2796 TaxID=1331199 RepID=A0ABR4R9T9_BORBO|nr:acyloxyacyl hydrolase [Bordetella bronchiseptica]AWQ06866.1 hypothetical protein B9G73_19790 [Bordetella bronchiseptica]KCV31908.1 lipid A 3-O-deacylase domain protein [Bordetella bronchiseptica 00-P-2796]
MTLGQMTSCSETVERLAGLRAWHGGANRGITAGRGMRIILGMTIGALPAVSAAQGRFVDAKMYVQAGATSLQGNATHAMNVGVMVPSGLLKGISRDAGPLTLHWDLWGGHWRSHHADGTTGGYSQLGALMAWRYQPAGPQSPWFFEAGLGGSVADGLYNSGRRRFSTTFQFTEVLAVGYRFGPERAYEVSLRVQHFSNAGIKKPNPGENFMFLRFSLPW